MPGLDPGIHGRCNKRKPYRMDFWRLIMDCRVKPGNDSWRVIASLLLVVMVAPIAIAMVVIVVAIAVMVPVVR
jgi:hypothetical protein